MDRVNGIGNDDRTARGYMTKALADFGSVFRVLGCLVITMETAPKCPGDDRMVAVAGKRGF